MWDNAFLGTCPTCDLFNVMLSSSSFEKCTPQKMSDDVALFRAVRRSNSPDNTEEMNTTTSSLHCRYDFVALLGGDAGDHDHGHSSCYFETMRDRMWNAAGGRETRLS